jgi:hypothetical protein
VLLQPPYGMFSAGQGQQATADWLANSLKCVEYPRSLQVSSFCDTVTVTVQYSAPLWRVCLGVHMTYSH